MNYFDRDYEAQIETREFLVGVLNYLQKQNSMLEALSAKVDNLTEFARKYENYNKENAGTLIESFTDRSAEIDTLKEICGCVEDELNRINTDIAYSNSQIGIQEGRLKKLDADMGYNNSKITTQESRLNRLESHAKAHWGYHPY